LIQHRQRQHNYFFRYTTINDRKARGAENKSEYYRQNGNPNYDNMKGLITRSKKRALNTQKFRGNTKEHLQTLYKDIIIVKPTPTIIISEDEPQCEEERIEDDNNNNDEQVKFTVVLPPKPQSEVTQIPITESKRKYSTDDDNEKRRRRRRW